LVLAWAIAGFFLEERVGWTDACLWAGLVALVTAELLRRRVSGVTVTSTIWAVAAAMAVANVFLVAVSVNHYGDASWFRRALAQGPDSMHRWLGGYALLKWLYEQAVAIEPLAELAANKRVFAAHFVRVLSILVVTGGTIALHRGWPGRLSLHLATLTPIWILFAAGPIEYYPFIGVPLLALLQWTLDKPLDQRSAWAVGLVAALAFPIAYIGFAPVAVFLLLAFAFASPRRALPALVVALLVAAISVHFLSPDGISGYLRGFDRLPSGHRGLAKVYVGQTAGPGSIFFSWEYALSPSHLRHMALMWSFGAGVFVLPLAILGLAAGIGRRRATAASSRLLAEPRWWFSIAVVGWFAYYFLRMVPRLGPIRDIDLFAPAYLVGAFYTGWLLDRTLDRSTARSLVLRRVLFAVFIGASVYMAAHLVVHGVGSPKGAFSDGWLH
jgi:hypothetical protein